MAFPGSAPPAGGDNTSSGRLQAAGDPFGRATQKFAMGLPGANGNAAPSNPFAKMPHTHTTQAKPAAPFNPFTTKAFSQPTAPAASIFTHSNAPATAAVQPPNPFQAALNKTQASSAAVPAAPLFQRAASPFGGFGASGQVQKSTQQPASGPFAAQHGQQPNQAALPSPFFATPPNAPTAAPAQSPLSQTAQSPAVSTKNGASGVLGNTASVFGAASQPSTAASFSPSNQQAQTPSHRSPLGAPNQGFQPPPPEAHGPQSRYAERIKAQLRKDNINPPQWPSEPGNPAKRMAMETYRENYKKYRDQARASLIKGGLIDDPEVRKRLDEAIDFKGICEDMCPDFEKISRIVQYDVKMAEKSEGSDGTMWASPPLMVKALARSAAGQEAPLPMDVRSVASLKRTLDYLIDTVLGDDSRLPTMHNFLWDRTRAIRRDFVFHSTMSDQEMLEQVYCLETITRFHTVALHLLSQKGFAAEDFSEQQEIEQLGKALLSLMQAYNDCQDKGIVCRNEAEFRAYFILLNAHDPDFQSKVSEWGADLWNESDDIQTALTLVQAMQSVWDWRGPLKPHVPTVTALGAFTTYFRIVESPQVSYMMACVAEIFFVHVRRGILRNTVRAYARTRDSPKDLTVAALNAMLRFDTDDEARDFVTLHNLEFSSDTLADAYLLLDKKVHIGSPTVRQSYSQKLVERKRGGRPLPETIHSTVFETEGQAANARPSAINGSAATTSFAASAYPSIPSDISNSLFVDPSPNLAPPVDKTTGSSQVFPAPAAVSKFSGAAAATTASPFSASSFFAARPPSTAPSLSSASSVAPATSQSTVATTVDNSINGSKRKEPDQEKRNVGRQDFASLFQMGNNKDRSRSTSKETETQPTVSVSGNAPFALSPSLSTARNPFLETSAASSSFQPDAAKKANNPFAQPSPKPVSDPVSSMFTPTADNTVATPSKSMFAPDAAKAPGLSATPPSSNRTAVPADLFTGSSSQARKAATPLLSLKPTPTATAGQGILFAKATTPDQSALQQQPRVTTSAAQPVKADPMGDVSRWVVLGDDGILADFKVAFVEHLVQQAFAQFQYEEEERVRREEDERSWAEARRFKTYNLSVKYFYRWRNIARERALDRRARQARDDMRAYQAAKRAEQRVTAEKAAERAVAEAHERAAEMRRMNSREVKFLEELGYYGTFGGASSRKRKASIAGSERMEEQQQDEGTDVDMVTDAVTAEQQREKKGQELQRLPVRQSLKDGFSSTVARAKELLTRSRSNSNDNGNGNGSIRKMSGRASLGSLRSLACLQNAQGRESLDNGSMSGDSMRSSASVRSIGSLDSIGNKMVAYYRRSVPGKGRTSSIYTRVAVPPVTTATAASTATATLKKTTNFMRYRSHSNSNSNSRQRTPSMACGSRYGAGVDSGRGSSPALSHRSTNGANGGYQSNVRSNYWRLRALGLVQMPNKQYLHESLALPMLQDGKRFRGVGSYGLPPVPMWDEDKANREAMGEEEGREKELEEELDAEQDVEQADPFPPKLYTEERRRRSLVAASARKRVFSGGHDSARVYDAGGQSDGVDGGVKRPKKQQHIVSTDADGATAADETDETERVIREMREMADAMDQGRDWFREQTQQMKKGTSVWDQ